MITYETFDNNIPDITLKRDITPSIYQNTLIYSSHNYGSMGDKTLSLGLNGH